MHKNRLKMVRQKVENGENMYRKGTGEGQIIQITQNWRKNEKHMK